MNKCNSGPWLVLFLSLFLYQMSTTSLSTLYTCSPIRPTTRPPSRSLLTSSSEGDNPCADSSNASFGFMPESTSPTFQDSDFAGDLEDSKPISEGSYCIFGSRTFCFHKLAVQQANAGGILGSTASPWNRSIFASHDWPGKTTSFVLRKLTGKMSFHKLFKYYILNSGCLVHSC